MENTLIVYNIFKENKIYDDRACFFPKLIFPT